MASRRGEVVAGQIRSLLILGSSADLSDGQLLARFASGDDPASSLAFEALVDRHGLMVLRVCRSVLRDPHDAQDAFQATFLVLVKKARSIRDRDSLASWLHGVALRVARHARGAEVRRRRLDRASIVERSGWILSDESDDAGSRLHEEVGKLPERYRAPVVLCYLEGLTSEEAARALGWPVGTVKSRLSRARDRLKRRLTRLGLAPESSLERPTTGRAISPKLTKATAEVAARFEGGKPFDGSTYGAFLLAKGALKAMTLAKWKIPALALLAAGSWAGVSATLTAEQPETQAPAKVQDLARPTIKPLVKRWSEVQRPAPKPEDEGKYLLAPRALKATPGTGSALMYALDAMGNRILAPGAEPNVAPRGNDRRAFLETTKDLQWVVVVGLLDHRTIQQRWAKARGVEPDAFPPPYKRVEAEFQVRLPDGKWSAWKSSNKEKTYEVLDHLPEITREELPESYLIPNLVDPLPLLKKGRWEGVNSTSDELFQWQVLSERRGQVARPDAKPSSTLLVRCFDFDVASGVTYRYRLRTVFANPEANQIRNVPKTVVSDWSEPTAEVKVP